MEFVGLEGSPTHNLVTVDAVVKPSGGYLEELKDIFDEDLIDFFGKNIFPVPLYLQCFLSLQHFLFPSLLRWTIYAFLGGNVLS